MTYPAIDERSARVGYAVNPLDRRSDKREDAAFIADQRAHPAALFHVVVGDQPLLKRKPHAGDALLRGGYEAALTNPLDAPTDAVDPWFTGAETDGLGDLREWAFLGLTPDHEPRFAIAVAPEALETLAQRSDLEIGDLRALAMRGLFSSEVLGTLGEAKALLDWHRRHRFCANCGEPTTVGASGWRRECAQCSTQHFPRVDPVVIMLAVRGDTCLLGRQPRFPAGMYSALAGFLEPGETIEDAVRREIHEEAGISCGQVSYHASQPWPFPSSLMIGCIAQATSDTITIDATELEDARWFTREEVRLMLDRRHPDGLMTPPYLAIAHHLIRDFADASA
jgi:NAD+ diphosphatase